jgi:hypothetical protein
MDWQQVVALVLVAGATALLLRSLLTHSRRKESPCGSTCACPGERPPEQRTS